MSNGAGTAHGTEHRIVDYRYLVNEQEGHHKFYEIVVTVKGDTFEVKGRWGKIGYRAMEQVKYLGADESAAMSAATAMLKTRFQHGYEVVERVSA